MKFKKSQFKFNQGFTLIELIVVIAIIGIISTIGVSSYTNYLKVARDAKRKADIDLLLKTVINFQTVNGRAPTEIYCNDTSVGGDPSACGSIVFTGTWDRSRGIWPELVNGGWLPSGLPHDPINNLSYYYHYEPYNSGDYRFPSGVLCTTSYACGGYLRAWLETGGIYTVYWKGHLE